MNDEDKTASEIQDLMIEKLKTLGIFKSLFTTPMETWQPADLPAAAVYLVEEVMDSDGNAGEPHFLHRVTYGFQAIVVSSDSETQRAKIVEALGKLDQAILTDPDILMPLEEVSRIQRRFRFERTAELPVAMLNSAMLVTFRSRWAPVVPDDFKLLHVETIFPVGSDPSTVDQVKAQWDIYMFGFGIESRLTGIGVMRVSAIVVSA